MSSHATHASFAETGGLGVVRCLGEVTPDHVFAVLSEMALGVRGLREGEVVHRRAGYLGDVAMWAVTPGLGPGGPSPSAGAVAGLLLETRRWAEEYPQDWLWAQEVLGRVSLEPGALLIEAAQLPSPPGAPGYGAPVPVFLERDAYQMVAVDDLPFAHEPTRCAYREDFERLKDRAERRARFASVMPWWRTALSPEQVAGREVWEQHQQQRWEACDRHETAPEVFRQAVADAHAIVLDPQGPWERKAVYRKHFLSRGGEPLDPLRRLTWSLLGDPVRWQRGYPQVNGGQHRICGARAAGCTHLLVAAG